jgi:hypothetical protein
VVARLGAPDELKGVNGGMIALYYYRDSRYSRANFGMAGSYWLPVSPDLVLSDSGLAANWFQVVIDSNWVIREYAFSRHADQARVIPWPFRSHPDRKL